MYMPHLLALPLLSGGIHFANSLWNTIFTYLSLHKSFERCTLHIKKFTRFLYLHISLTHSLTDIPCLCSSRPYALFDGIASLLASNEKFKRNGKFSATNSCSKAMPKWRAKTTMLYRNVNMRCYKSTQSAKTRAVPAASKPTKIWHFDWFYQS